MRSSNHGWRVDQTCGSICDRPPPRVAAMAAMATMVRFVSMASHAVRSPPVPPSPERLRRARRRRHSAGRARPVRPRHRRAPRRRGPPPPPPAAATARHPRMAATGMEADLEEAGVEAGTAGGDAHVASESEVHAGPDGRFADRKERRQRATGGAGTLVDRAQARATGIPQVAEVRPGTERRRRPSHDQCAKALVGLHPGDGGDDLLHHRRGQRVPLGGIVQG